MRLLTNVRWDFNYTMEGRNTSVHNVLVQDPKQAYSLAQDTKLKTMAFATQNHTEYTFRHVDFQPITWMYLGQHN